MKHLSIDIETFSSVDIKKSGLYKYVQSLDFEILLIAYSIDFGSVEIVDLTRGEELPEDIILAILDINVNKHAYNAAFEWYCLSKWLGLSQLQMVGWLSQWRCTMLHGLYCGYVSGLGATATAMGFPTDKKKIWCGNTLIKIFCVPCEPTAKNGQRTRIFPKHEPEKWELFKKYCEQDVIVEMAIAKKLENFPVINAEQKLWEIDQEIAVRGVGIDMDVVTGAIEISETTNVHLISEAMQISGLKNPKSVAQLKKWLEEETETEIENLRKDTVAKLLPIVESGNAKRMLAIRQEISKTSIEKYRSMVNVVCEDGRVRGILQFYGANRTGRWAGRLVQLHNLPRNYLGTISNARKYVKHRNIDALKIIYGNVPDTLSQLIRTAFVPKEGKVFIVADFSAIEARVIAWLAKEQWRLGVFATHGKIYEASASAMFGVPLEKIIKGNLEYELRQKGKIAELALGYGGSKPALIRMGALDMGLSEEELSDIVYRWRQVNKQIVNLWYSLENAAVETVRTGRAGGFNGILFTREYDSQNGVDFLAITLPIGRKLFYVQPFLAPNKWGKASIHYYGVCQQSKKWSTVGTYGGKLVENVVQAIARDCLAENIKRLHMLGFEIVFHVHDEIIIEGNAEDIKTVCSVMNQEIPWAKGLQLKTEGFEATFYKKD